MIYLKPRYLLFCVYLGLLSGCSEANQSLTKDSITDAISCFNSINDSSRTKTWWFHGETETTKEGITADLEAFKKAGLGGVVYYDQSHGKAENAYDGFSNEWWEMLCFAAKEAKRIGLSFEIHISNGYVAGGSWITNEYGMKRLASTELVIDGGRYFEGVLDAPLNKFNFYKDVAVLAFPAPEGAGISSSNQPVKITSNNTEIDLKNMFDPKSDKLSKVPVYTNSKPVYINLEFDEPFTARSISYQLRPKGKATSSATNVPGPAQETFVGTGYRILPDLGQLEVSQDGINYSKVCDLKPIYRAHESWRQKTISFAAVKGKYYRLNLHDWWEKDKTPDDLQIGNLVLHAAAKVDQWEEKAGFFSEYIEEDKTPDYYANEAVDFSKIINLTDKMSPDGTLKWEVPAGRWMVMRFAYVPTGGSTKHGRKNLMGRECDKLSVEAAEYHWNHYVQVIIDSLKSSNSGNLSGVAMDSHEAGAQNWTDDFIQEFISRQGYDPTLYLPAMMGYVINDVETSNGFLFDIRRNIADMISDNYYGTFERLCNDNGLIFTAQAIGNALCIVGDPIQAKSKVSKPQGEFWPIHPDGNYDIKESSSAAHLYNKPIASAEAFTDAKYFHSLSDLKSYADYAYAFGINEFVICASPHQPWLDKIPGSTGGGRQYAINRNNTWWDYSKAFWDYQARNAGILRLGKSSIDLCVYLGENAPVKILTYRLPNIPGGFDFDAFTSHALHTRMSAQDGRITLPDGVSYKMMILPRNCNIPYKALEKIAEMVKEGITIYGDKPNFSESYQDHKKRQDYQKLADELWGVTPNNKGFDSVGKGKVYWGMHLSEALNQAKIKPDISMKTGDTKSNKIYFTHRSLSDAEIYFLDNHKDTAEENTFSFSVSGKQAQLWNTVTGQRFSIPISSHDENSLTIPLYMAARESYFIVISDKSENL
ncbi:MAG: glycosyl hydrolase, partial [Bacteroidales bacterium]|nr:glycosyl hydrolase [Bacteroidales bacterium]